MFTMPFQSAVEYVMGRFLRLLTKLPLQRLVSLVAQERSFLEYFSGFENNVAVRGIFGVQTEEVLTNLKVDFIWFGYMGVSDSNGHMLVNKRYLTNGSREDIYLDIIHELCHVKQHLEGRDLFDPRYDYVDRPTEIEAYRYAVQEAKRIGVSDSYIRIYLKAGPIGTVALEKLIRNMGVPLEVS
jgi:hypothetical protein